MMKKALIILLLAALAVSNAFSAGFSIAGVAQYKWELEPEKAGDDLGFEAAKDYIKVLYNKATMSNPAPRTSSDYKVMDVVTINNVVYPISWSVDTEFVKLIPGNDHEVIVDIDETSPVETVYNLTATITNASDGSKAEIVIPHTLPAGKVVSDPSYEEIVELAYALEAGEAMKQELRLSGKVVAIPTPWSDQYKNITVNIQIGQLADKLIQCYRLSGDGAQALAVGDVITVSGILKNYKGTIEFDKGCQLLGLGDIPNQAALLDAAFALEAGEAMKAKSVLVGTVVAIPTPWSDKYKNITVNIAPVDAPDRVVQCYRLGGADADKLAVGDKMAVLGTIKNYKGTIEFDQGCILIPAGHYSQTKVLLAAYALDEGKALEAQRTLTGVISAVNSPWNDQYKNITVTIVCDGLGDYPVQCYRLSGEGAESLAIGDEITVTGMIKNYKGTIEFDKGCTIVR